MNEYIEFIGSVLVAMLLTVATVAVGILTLYGAYRFIMGPEEKP